ncbi:hypothetical protein SAMD00019534_041600 [Acytostelium subglobosum LB1]|uniref:hypothetical protein n=1 Tax=Acytostelium subglobosum LB1 TaxID=1410327 RepID=UPI00064497AC|nr:hypothetical protein SAMD00019534_041600 [Acytostelium subglobosum LB1]GAM20985.1 hypothetical protein SAMD00019534_041600 [Acytostelium subglobosum LB1]|eukprot:XP_012756119.1 hypothetical protein SAMD00019534_041600 [Acytostelium subglobosum LB1]
MLNIDQHRDKHGANYFSELCKRGKNEHTEQILLDVPRTFPNNKRYFTKRGKQDLLDVLQSYSYHNANVGYCQGMSYIVGVFLMYLTKEEAFWMLVALLERDNAMGFYISGMPKLLHDAKLFLHVLEIENNELAQHLKKNGIDPLLYVTPWWMCFFTTLAKWDVILRIWDLVLLDGVPSLFRISLAILCSAETQLLSRKGAEGLLPFLLHPPLDEIGGIETILSKAIAYPIADLMVNGEKKLAEETSRNNAIMSAKKKRPLANSSSGTNSSSSATSSPSLTSSSSESLFGRILNTFSFDLDTPIMSTGNTNNNSYSGNGNGGGYTLIKKNSSDDGDVEMKGISSPRGPKQPTPANHQQIVQTDDSAKSLTNRVKEFSMRLKDRFINRGYQPCRVIHEQPRSVHGRKSTARPSTARKSVANRGAPITPRKSIVNGTAGHLGRPSTMSTNNINNPRRSVAHKRSMAPRQHVDHNMDGSTSTTTTTTSTSITWSNNSDSLFDNMPPPQHQQQQELVGVPSTPRQQKSFTQSKPPLYQGANRTTTVTVGRKSIRPMGGAPSMAKSKIIHTQQQQTQHLHTQSQSLSPLPSPSKSTTTTTPITSSSNVTTTTTPISSAKAPSPLKSTSTSTSTTTSRLSTSTPYSPHSIKIGPPPPPSTPILKALAPCTNNNSSNNLLNILNNSNTPVSSGCGTINSNATDDIVVPVSPFKRLRTNDMPTTSTSHHMDLENATVWQSAATSVSISPMTTPTKSMSIDRKPLTPTSATNKPLSGNKKMFPVSPLKSPASPSIMMAKPMINKKTRPQASFWFTPMGI